MRTLEKKRVGRRLPVGAEPVREGGVHFRLWAPIRTSVHVLLRDERIALEAEEENGYFSGTAAQARVGMTYRYVLDGGDAFPDPASRYQPEGPHGPSQVVDPAEFKWTDPQWTGVELAGQVIYEMHVGTFTREGTWEGAIRELPHLAATGITVIELMPVADFSGEFGWGYDGVNWFAPCRLYGSPDSMRRFVDTAHALGIGVILDVVYNHFGPDGNYIGQFSPHYFTHKHTTDWGDAINYYGEHSAAVREFVESNAAYWIDEYHLDGLRLDATQNIYDDSKKHILTAVTDAVRRAAGKRKTIVVAENEPQDVRLINPPSRGGYGIDGLWNDDLHHSVVVAVTGRNEAYYTDYLGKPQELVSAMKYGYLYQGQWYKWQKQRRGTASLDMPQSAFVTYIENHDQVANSARGLRLHQMTSPGIYRAITALTVLGTGTPMLFQGQEFGSTAPFLYFADMPEGLLPLVRDGRKEFMAQWRSLHNPSMLDGLADPCSRETFERCKLDHSERERNSSSYRFHRDLIQLRLSDPILGQTGRCKVDGAILSSHAFLLRYFGPEGDDRLLLVNLGRDLPMSPAPEPLLASPGDRCWRTLFSTESPEYGGAGAVAYEEDPAEWTLTGQAAVLLASCANHCNSNDSKENSD